VREDFTRVGSLTPAPISFKIDSFLPTARITASAIVWQECDRGGEIGGAMKAIAQQAVEHKIPMDLMARKRPTHRRQ